MPRSMLSAAVLAASSAVLATPAGAQSLNIDCVEQVGAPTLPADGYGAAAGQPGRWQAVKPTTLAAGQALVDLAGQATGASLAWIGSTSISSFTLDNPAWTGDDHALLDDTLFFESFPQPDPEGRMRFAGLANGSYALYTYATSGASVTVPGSAEGTVLCGGGAWPGDHAAGVSYALHHVSVTNGTLDLTIATVPGGYNDWNGGQLVLLDGALSTSCAGDGAACPCGNPGAPGRGCASSLAATGALLAGSGTASVASDTLALGAVGVSNAFQTLFQGAQVAHGGAGAPFGDGVACLGGSIVRIATRLAGGHAWSYPAPGELPISVRGALPATGGVRHYQLYYRNAASYCTPATFNLTNAVRVAWAP